MSYSDKTYNSKNPFQRYSHRTRLSIGEKLLPIKQNNKLLDYGCGDGAYLINVYHKHKEKELTLVGFEPYMEIPKQNGIKIKKNINEIINEKEKFDVICCFEVLEHFNEKNQIEIIDNFKKLLKTEGTIIVSVPIEMGMASLLKNGIRKINYPNNKAYQIKNLLKCLVYSPPEEYRLSDGYLGHMGFDHRQLEKLFCNYFTIEKKIFSPFPFLGSIFNSQIFYFLKYA